MEVSDASQLPSTDLDAGTHLTVPKPAPPLPRWFAALQVVLVCGVPTSLAVYQLLFAIGIPMTGSGLPLASDVSDMSLQFLAMSSLLDTAFIALLILLFLTLSRERSSDVFLGGRSTRGEVVRGLAVIPVLIAAVVAMVAGLDALMPSLHNVPNNPLAAFIDTPLHAGVFVVVVILAGGVREELQRGFILHRFEQCLGGAWVGLAVFSLLFTAFHLEEGRDVALTVGALGVFWGVLYIRRRSVVIAMVSHAGFDVAEVLQALAKVLSR